ncbi:hypothetical protein PQ610_06670 [Tardisphaera miroshnichenkoae]
MHACRYLTFEAKKGITGVGSAAALVDLITVITIALLGLGLVAPIGLKEVLVVAAYALIVNFAINDQPFTRSRLASSSSCLTPRSPQKT